MIETTTYDGSGQSVHPDVVLFPAPWHGSKHWVAMTPYPFGNSGYENPSLLVSEEGTLLETPHGIVNPLVPMPLAPAYNSDPDLTYDARFDRLVLSYRVVASGYNTIMIMSSADGQAWSAPHVAFRESGNRAVSQSIVPSQEGRTAMVWYVDAGNEGCSAKSTRVMMRRASSSDVRLDSADWQSGVETDLAQPGYVVWHMKVEFVPSKNEYWALYVAYPADGRSCRDDDLFMARSKDGVHWLTYTRAVLRHERRQWTAGALYRSSFVYDPQTDALRVWLSAVDAKQAWHLGYAQFRLASLFAHLAVSGRRKNDVSAAPPVRTAGADWRIAP